MKQTLYILQGLPGSGKSTIARDIKFGANNRNWVVICATDNYFIVNGKYVFDPTLLEEYHAANLANAKNHMDFGHTVVVDNTNTCRKHVKPYVEYAVNKGIPVVFIRVTGNFGSIHNVPEHVIQAMRERMEDLTLESVMAEESPINVQELD